MLALSVVLMRMCAASWHGLAENLTSFARNLRFGCQDLEKISVASESWLMYLYTM